MSLKRFFLQSKLVRSVFILTSGTVIAQAIGYLLTPFITRLFTPEEFGAYGFLMRIVAFIAILGAAQYEYTLPLPKRNDHALHLYRLSLRILALIVVTTLLVGLAYWWNEPTFSVLLFVLFAVGITAFTVFIGIGKHWAIRMQQFKLISQSTILRSGITNLSKLIVGLLGMGYAGLALATFIGVVGGSILYGVEAIKQFKNKFSRKLSKREVIMALKYKDFPKIQLPHTLIETGKELVIAVVLIATFSESLFGSYDHAFRMLRIPLLLIGASVGEVIYNKISADYAANKSVYPILRKTVLTLIIIGIIPFTVIYFYGGPLFEFVFGSQWKTSGLIAAAISPWLMGNFVLSSISMIPAIIGKLKWFFRVTMVVVAIQLGCFLFFNNLMQAFELDYLELFHLASWVFFVFYTFIIFRLLLIVKTSKYN